MVLASDARITLEHEMAFLPGHAVAICVREGT